MQVKQDLGTSLGFFKISDEHPLHFYMEAPQNPTHPFHTSGCVFSIISSWKLFSQPFACESCNECMDPTTSKTKVLFAVEVSWCSSSVSLNAGFLGTFADLLFNVLTSLLRIIVHVSWHDRVPNFFVNYFNFVVGYLTPGTSLSRLAFSFN